VSVLIILYWTGLLIETAIRIPLRKTWKVASKTDQRVSRIEKVMLGLLSVGGIILPLFYSVTHWLDFANYILPPWMGWIGGFLLTCALFTFACAHWYLKSNWSPSLEIFEGHTLVTNGIYSYIRHPMYASQWLWVIAQILLLQNWIAGPIALIIFIPFYILRVPVEEKMMLDIFGDQYRDYMEKTGGVIPKFKWSR
jgi:protein-S-isoprenylcysteine O-methyltransferase Ste14